MRRDTLRFPTGRTCTGAMLDAAIARGVADARMGRVTDADVVFNQLESKYTRAAHGKTK